MERVSWALGLTCRCTASWLNQQQSLATTSGRPSLPDSILHAAPTVQASYNAGARTSMASLTPRCLFPCRAALKLSRQSAPGKSTPVPCTRVGLPGAGGLEATAPSAAGATQIQLSLWKLLGATHLPQSRLDGTSGGHRIAWPVPSLRSPARARCFPVHACVPRAHGLGWQPTQASLHEAAVHAHLFTAVDSCGLDTGGTAWCWGQSLKGELGTGFMSSYQPVQVAGDYVFASLSANNMHVCGTAAVDSGEEAAAHLA